MSRLSREVVAQAAIEVADADGIDAVSMRRVAAHLGVGTMSLYHYVPTKQALFSAMGEAIMAENLIPAGEVPDNWRDGLAEIARRAHALFTGHDWVLASWNLGERSDPGPSFVAHVEQTLAIVAELDFLSIDDRLRLTGLVDEYVIGYVLRNQSQGTGDTWGAYLAEQAGTGAYPNLAAAFAEGFGDAGADTFEFGLERLLDGIEAYLSRAKRSA